MTNLPKFGYIWLDGDVIDMRSVELQPHHTFAVFEDAAQYADTHDWSEDDVKMARTKEGIVYIIAELIGNKQMALLNAENSISTFYIE